MSQLRVIPVEVTKDNATFMEYHVWDGSDGSVVSCHSDRDGAERFVHDTLQERIAKLKEELGALWVRKRSDEDQLIEIIRLCAPRSGAIAPHSSVVELVSNRIAELASSG